MHHHGSMDARKRATLQQQNLSAGIAHFFGGRADHVNGKAHFVCNFGRGERRSNRRCGDDVVATGMADTGQAIVFSANANVQRAGSGPGAERRGKVANTLLRSEAGVGQKLTQPIRGLLFLKTQLGMSVDTMAEID